MGDPLRQGAELRRKWWETPLASSGKDEEAEGGGRGPKVERRAGAAEEMTSLSRSMERCTDRGGAEVRAGGLAGRTLRFARRRQRRSSSRRAAVAPATMQRTREVAGGSIDSSPTWPGARLYQLCCLIVSGQKLRDFDFSLETDYLGHTTDE
jgi:hypothetical protein